MNLGEDNRVDHFAVCHSAGCYTHANPVNPVIVSSTSYVYDQYGRQIEIIDVLNQSTHTVYDIRGKGVKQYGAIYPVWYEYDAEGRMVAMATTRDTTLDPATVDSLDHPSLDVTRWNYEPATGLLTQKLYDDGKGPSYTYTPDGKPATRTWARGIVTSYEYDGAGGLASVHYSDGTPPILKTYNRLGNPVMIVSAGTTNTFEYSATTLEKISDTQLGYAIRRGYDNLGRMETLSITNLYDSAYAYDAFGHMAEVTFEGLDFHYAYLPGADLVNGLTYGVVEKTVAFEANRNLVTGISYHTVAGALIAERTYTYNALGNVVARTRQRGADPVETDDFDHNFRSELVAASLGGTNALSGDYGYAYDLIGNRTVATNRGDVVFYDVNGLNQYTNIVAEVAFVPEFDDDGNQTLVKTSTGIWHVAYNAENRPVVWSNATFVIAMDYDFMGRRISKRRLAGQGETVDRQFLYDGHLQIAAIETNAVTTTFWDPTERVATRPLAMKDGGEVLTYTHDLTKNVMEVLDSAGDPLVVYDYDAFGAVTASRPYLNRFGFSSEYYDAALGCVYYNFRHYNPLDGRWVSRDPLDGISIYGRAYQYVKNCALSITDMLGLVEIERKLTGVDVCCLGGSLASLLLPGSPDDGGVPLPPAVDCVLCAGICGAMCEGSAGLACFSCFSVNPECVKCALGILDTVNDARARCFNYKTKCFVWEIEEKSYPFAYMAWNYGSPRPVCVYYRTNLITYPINGNCPSELVEKKKKKVYVPCTR